MKSYSLEEFSKLTTDELDALVDRVLNPTDEEIIEQFNRLKNKISKFEKKYNMTTEEMKEDFHTNNPKVSDDDAHSWWFTDSHFKEFLKFLSENNKNIEQIIKN